MKCELAKWKEEMEKEVKLFRESMERELRNEIREMKVAQTNLTKSIEFAHDEVRDLKKKLDDEVAKNKRLTDEKEALLSRCKAVENETREQEKRLASMEQYSRKNNLEIHGVIQTKNESVPDILAKIGSAINEPITATDVEVCHRVPARDADKTANIIVQFRSRTKRDAVLKKARKARPTHNDIGMNEATPIYVNEHLCPARKRLLAMAIKKKHEHKWKSVWTNNGQIFAKQTDDAPMVRISSEQDIEKVFSRPPAMVSVVASGAVAPDGDNP